jgi:DNA-binding beta-propeller fold protein YncE
MHRKHLVAAVAAVAAVALAGTALGGPASAEDPAAKPKPNVVVKGLVSPLSLAVTDDGTVYYAQNFAGMLLSKKRGKQPKVVYQDPDGNEVGAVSERKGSLRFAVTIAGDEEGQGAGAVLMGVGNSGRPTALADLGMYEEMKNPDQDVVYGFRNLPGECEVPPFLQAYNGIVESHPYATTQASGRTYVADAAGNSILKLGKDGRLSTVAVLPAQPLVVTEAVIEALAAQEVELPECTLGQTVYLEPVPTDVERGPDGKLYVTTLPGGPEDPSLGARGSVYKVDPKTGKVKKVVSGLLSPTGLTVGQTGKMYVAELFKGRIAQVRPGGEPKRLLQAVLPGDVEIRSNGDLYATTQVLVGPEGPEDPTPPGGQVIRIRR